MGIGGRWRLERVDGPMGEIAVESVGGIAMMGYIGWKSACANGRSVRWCGWADGEVGRVVECMRLSDYLQYGKARI